MIDSLSIKFYSLPMHVMTSQAVDEILSPKYVKWSLRSKDNIYESFKMSKIILCNVAPISFNKKRKQKVRH